MNQYQLIDSGDGLKLEQFGEYLLIRPCPPAIWKKAHPERWKNPDAEFSREAKKGWTYHRKMPKEWVTEIEGIRFKVAPTDFGQLGVFPEHAKVWRDLRALVTGGAPNILNLFGGCGGGTLCLAQEGAEVCHLDLTKGMVDWAKENGTLNNLEKSPIRWLVDDALKFLRREGRRESKYDAILLDPPAYGRTGKGEVFNIDIDLIPLLELCKMTLSQNARFVVLFCHMPTLTPTSLQNIGAQMFPEAEIEVGEMTLQTEGALPIPSGSFLKIIWKR